MRQTAFCLRFAAAPTGRHGLDRGRPPRAKEYPMPSVSDWKVPASAQPKPEDYGYDLEQALTCVVGLRTTVPADAFTAETLGTERAGNGVFIRGNGLVLTIGYLITEAETHLDHTQRRPLGARPRARLRSGDRIWPGAGACQARRAGARDRRVGRGRGRRTRRGRRLRRPRRSRSPRASSPSRNSPAIGNMCSTRRSSPRRRIRTGAAPR